MQKLVVAAALAAGLCVHAARASAVTYYFGGSLSADQQNLIYKKSDSKAGSASIELGLFEALRVGLTHEEMILTVKGYDQNEDKKGYTPVDDYTRLSANSLDTTLFLYKGEVFIPFAKAGFILKSYDFKTLDTSTSDSEDRADYAYAHDSDTLPTWQAGAGLAIRLNKQLSLRLSHMVSPGIELQPGQDATEQKHVLDRKSQIGLNYQIQ
jgi:opacity protein-like surface antigen